MPPKIQAVRKHNHLLFCHWATCQFIAQRYLLEPTSLWRKPQLMWAGPCPPCPVLPPSRGNQSHLCVIQLSVLVSFGAFWFSSGSDTYILFSQLCLSLCFSSKGQKMKRLCQSSAEQCFCSIMSCALCRYKGAEKKLRTGLAQTLLEECHYWRKTTVMWYSSMLLTWSECHDDLVSVSWFLLGINNWLASEGNRRLN